MFRPHDPSWKDVRPIVTSCCVVLVALLSACGGSTRRARVPQGQTTTTAATITPRVERLVVADRGSIAMVAREGCVASVRTSEGEAGAHDELRVRCPKPERLKAWFEGVDRVIPTLATEPSRESEGDDEEVTLPVAKLLTESGKTLRVSNAADIQKLAGEVRALSAELASAEKVTPGPASEDGWQMLYVTGPAHVLFAGTPARGVLEARMSTNGQYLCEFTADVGDGPIRATKSGWLSPKTASHAIDEVLGPLDAGGSSESATPVYAAGTKAGKESRSNTTSTAEVFDRFAAVQDALGDACLPELEPPSTPPVGL